MDWRSYLQILLRRWPLIAVIAILALLSSGYLFLKAYRHAAYQGCVTLYVADASAPYVVESPPTTISTAQLLAGESAANFFADDILDVAQGKNVAAYVSSRIAPQRLPNSATADISGRVGGSRRDRTVDLCVQNPNSATALAAAQSLGGAMTRGRAKFLGRLMARRTYVSVVSPASVGRVSRSRDILNFGLRLFLGIVVALGAALLWDALDPTVRDTRDVERALGAPVLATLW